MISIRYPRQERVGRYLLTWQYRYPYRTYVVKMFALQHRQSFILVNQIPVPTYGTVPVQNTNKIYLYLGTVGRQVVPTYLLFLHNFEMFIYCSSLSFIIVCITYLQMEPVVSSIPISSFPRLGRESNPVPHDHSTSVGYPSLSSHLPGNTASRQVHHTYRYATSVPRTFHLKMIFKVQFFPWVDNPQAIDLPCKIFHRYPKSKISCCSPF